jgi:hypothetical protein
LAGALRDSKMLGVRLESIQPQQIHACARISFEIAFGLSTSQQIDLERKLAAWSFDISTLSSGGDEWDVATWLCVNSMCEMYSL